jgi:hypothetical protein
MTAQPEADPKRNRPTGIGILTLPPSECRSQNSKCRSKTGCYFCILNSDTCIRTERPPHTGKVTIGKSLKYGRVTAEVT